MYIYILKIIENVFKKVLNFVKGHYIKNKWVLQDLNDFIALFIVTCLTSVVIYDGHTKPACNNKAMKSFKSWSTHLFYIHSRETSVYNGKFGVQSLVSVRHRKQNTSSLATKQPLSLVSSLDAQKVTAHIS